MFTELWCDFVISYAIRTSYSKLQYWVYAAYGHGSVYYYYCIGTQYPVYGYYELRWSDCTHLYCESVKCKCSFFIIFQFKIFYNNRGHRHVKYIIVSKFKFWIVFIYIMKTQAGTSVVFMFSSSYICILYNY